MSRESCVLSVSSVCLLLTMCHMTDTASLADQSNDEKSVADRSEKKLTTPDPHGGVKMGVSDFKCDNGEHYIYYDWDPSSTREYTCNQKIRPKATVQKKLYNCTEKADKPIHKCLPGYIKYKDPLPTSGPHRPLWPMYGEYTYLPPQRWLHSLEHGAVAFLYHPCTDPAQVDILRGVARQCLRRHVISPSNDIPEGYNFALLTWTCKLLLAVPDTQEMVDFVKSHAKHGREPVASDGQYGVGLIHHSETVSNFNDDILCPHLNTMKSTLDTVRKDAKKRQDKAKSVDRQMVEALHKLNTH